MGERNGLSRSPDSTALPLLEQTRLFAHLDSEGLRQLAARASMRRYRRGEVVFREGDPGDWLFVVGSGRLKVVVSSAQGDEMVLAALTPPDTFGELALVDGEARSATVEALEASVLLVVTRAAFLDVLHERPALAEGLLESLGGLIRRLTDQTSDLVFLDLPGRGREASSQSRFRRPPGTGTGTCDRRLLHSNGDSEDGWWVATERQPDLANLRERGLHRDSRTLHPHRAGRYPTPPSRVCLNGRGPRTWPSLERSGGRR